MKKITSLFSAMLCMLLACGLFFSPAVSAEEETQAALTPAESRDVSAVEAITLDLEDGEYAIATDLKGGSGKAGVATPTLMIVRDAKAYAKLTWSSSNYDYMLVDGVKYVNLAEEGADSVFEIPITAMDSPMDVVGDTTAMGTPHEVKYQLTFFSDTIDSKSTLPQEEAKKVVVIALIIIVGGGILNAYVKKKLRA